MRHIFFAEYQDGPSRELMPHLDLARRFTGHQLITDFDGLELALGRGTAPTLVWLLMPQDGLAWPSHRLLHEIRRVCAAADAVILMLTEVDILWDHLRDISQISNLWIMAPAQHNFAPPHRPWIIWQHWIQDLRRSWQHQAIQQRLDQIGSNDQRAYLFDVLLGGERPYRTLLHDLIESDPGLRHRVLMSYYGVQTARPKFILEPEMQDFQWPDPMHTGFLTSYHGVSMRAACVPPVSVYQQTWFTVLAETSAHGCLNFYTEKVAKPLLAGRLFLVLGGQHYLRGLRRAGFWTFHGIVDESYDQEADDAERFHMVFREMQKLAHQDPRELLLKAKPIIDHNRFIAREYDLLDLAVVEAKRLVEQHLEISSNPSK